MEFNDQGKPLENYKEERSFSSFIFALSQGEGILIYSKQG